MDQKQFWKIIEQSKVNSHGVEHLQRENLVEILKGYSKQDLIGFSELYHNTKMKAYRYDIWAAVLLFEGMCSDDAFTDFIDLLVSKGQQIFEAVVKDPDDIADLFTSDDCLILEYHFMCAASEAYNLANGNDIHHDDDSFDYSVEWPDRPAGERIWDSEERMKAVLPKLSRFTEE